MQRKIQPNRIINGDCIKVMAGMRDACVDFILIDPPYLVNYRSRDGRSLSNDDNDRWLKPAYAEMYRVLRPNSFCVSFYGWNHVDQFMAAWREAGFRPIGHITFPKEYASKTGFVKYEHENAYLLAKGYPKEPEHPIGDVIPWTVYTGNRLHPTQKPVEILTPLIRSFSQPGDLVLEPMCGSGSACAAARLLGRRYLGIELDPTYAETARRRMETLEQHSRQRALGDAPSRQSSQEQAGDKSVNTSFHQPVRSVRDMRKNSYASVRVSFKEKMEQMLIERGMSKSQANMVLQLAMSASSLKGISHLWGKDVKMYSPMMQDALWRVVHRCAIDWMKGNCPDAPFRVNFPEHAREREITA